MKAREAALLAVEIYNRPGTVFRSGAYIMLMVVAWTALFHAIFFRERTKPFHVVAKRGRYVRYRKEDGENKAWELSECLSQFYKDKNPPERTNLEFFIGLRNKIEHRNMPQLDDRIFGECQALLLNFERRLSEQFGDNYSLNESLAVSLQFSTITPQAKAQALRKLQSRAYYSVTEYIERFKSSLSADVLDNLEYAFRVFLFPKTGNHAKSSELAVEFVDISKLDPAARREYEKLNVILKTRIVSVTNSEMSKPGDVAEKVRRALAVKFIDKEHAKCFTTSDHVKCWKHFGVRPAASASEPTKCDTKYCLYDVPHKDYIYTDAWEKFLIEQLSNPTTYQEILGKRPNLVT